jgi:hypothetical protein
MLKLAVLFLAGALTFPKTVRAISGEGCGDLQRLIQATYKFKPSKLSKAEQSSAAAKMDQVWRTVESNPKELAPCLHAALEAADVDPWFRIDGSNLLVSVDPSQSAKAIQVRAYLGADLDDVSTQVWVETLARRGAEGFDVSQAGARWLANPKLKYYLPIHGGFEVGAFPGALFLFGSVDEALALGPLVKIANQAGHPGREIALWILTVLATPEALKALREVNTSGLSEEATEGFRRKLDHPDLIEPAAKPEVSREEFLQILRGAAKVDWDRVDKLRRQERELEQSLRLSRQAPPDAKLRDRLAEVEKQRFMEEKPWDDMTNLFWSGKPAERDAVAVLRAEDLRLLRMIRRRIIAACNQHAMEQYEQLSQLLDTLVRKHATAASLHTAAPESNQSIH